MASLNMAEKIPCLKFQRVDKIGLDGPIGPTHCKTVSDVVRSLIFAFKAPGSVTGFR